MSEKLEAIVPGSTWVSKETGLSVEIVSVKDGAVWWKNENVWIGAQQTGELEFREAMRPLRMSSQTELQFSSPIKSADFRTPKCCAPGGKMAGFLAWSSRRNREGGENA